MIVYQVEYRDNFQCDSCQVTAAIVSSLELVPEVVKAWNVDTGEFWVYAYTVDDVLGDIDYALQKWTCKGERIK